MDKPMITMSLEQYQNIEHRLKKANKLEWQDDKLRYYEKFCKEQKDQINFLLKENNRLKDDSALFRNNIQVELNELKGSNFLPRQAINKPQDEINNCYSLWDYILLWWSRR